MIPVLVMKADYVLVIKVKFDDADGYHEQFTRTHGIRSKKNNTIFDLRYW